MTDPSDPPRLADRASSAPERVRSILERVRDDVASDREFATLEALLAPLLGPGASSSSTGTKGALGSTATTLKIGLAALIAAGAGGLFVASRHEPNLERPAAIPTSNSALATPPFASGPPTDSSTPLLPPLPPPSLDAPRGVVPAPAASPSPLPDGPGRSKRPISEADLLGKAQTALASDPARALSFAEQHRGLYPRGVLVQEREVIAIEALAKLGRTAQARSRADAFFRAFPGSAYRNKVQSSVQMR